MKNFPASGAAALRTAKQLASTYRYNRCTPDIWEHLLQTVKEQGSLAGMLQHKAGPLLHQGYRLAAPTDGCDLQHLGLSSQQAVLAMAQLVLQVHSGKICSCNS